MQQEEKRITKKYPYQQQLVNNISNNISNNIISIYNTPNSNT